MRCADAVCGTERRVINPPSLTGWEQPSTVAGGDRAQGVSPCEALRGGISDCCRESWLCTEPSLINPSPNLSPQGRGILKPLLVIALLFCASGTSCARSLRSPFAAWTPPAPEVLTGASTLDQITAAVNQNAARIHSYQTNNASITVPGMPAIPLLRGNIAAQRPGRIRLQASTMLGPEVDMGANDELFWFWVKRNESPALYFARHEQFAGSAAQQLMPVEPQWLLDALGFAEFRPGDFHEGPLPLDKGKVEIKSTVQSRTGTLIKRTIVDARRAWVLEQHVYDAAGTLLASAVARSHRYYPQLGASLPQEVDIRIPASELSLSIDVGTVAINALGENPQLWTMPTIAGAPPTDLGATAAAGGVQRFGDQLTRANWDGPSPATGAPPMIAFAAPMQPLPGPPGVQSASAAPQFVTPGGVVAQPADPFVTSAPAAAQRLPAGGVPADSMFVR